MKKSKKVEDLLPLRPAHYLILVSLTGGDRHGYALKKEIIQRTDGRVRLGAGSLYRSISQLVDLGLIEESEWRPEASVDDERRQYYRLTELGREAALAETERLAALVQGARASGLTG